MQPPTCKPLSTGTIAARFGFAPEIFVRAAARIGATLTDHPVTAVDGNRVPVFFLHDPAAQDEAALGARALPGDGWHIGPRRHVRHPPAGFGILMQARKLRHLLPVPTTARNLRTVAALQAPATWP